MRVLSWILCGFMDFGCAFDGLWHGIVTFFAALIWKLEQLMLQLGGVLHWVRRLIVGDEGISQSLLGEVMDRLLVDNDLLKNLMGGALLLAGLLLCFTFMLRPIANVVSVEPGKVVGWILFALVMFEAGPGFAQGLEKFRDDLREGAYQSVERADYSGVLSQANGDFVTGSDLCGQANCADNFVHVMAESTGPCEGGRGCNGIDASALFLMANTDDIVGRSPQGSDTRGLPVSLYNRFFVWPADDGQANRDNAKNLAAQGFVRVVLGFFICIFALVEALIFLLLAAAAMVLFITIPIAMPFAFFSMTEVILLTLVRKYLSILVLTFVAQTMITILMMMMIFFAGKGNGVLFIAVGLLSAAIIIWGFLGHATGSLKGSIGAVGASAGLALGVQSANATNASAALRAGRLGTMALAGGAAVVGGAIGAGAVVRRQGGIGHGGGTALAQAGLHVARTRIASAVGRTPLAGMGAGFSGAQNAHRQAERAREQRLERNAAEALDVLTGRTHASAGMLRRAEHHADEYLTMKQIRDVHTTRAANLGLGRLTRGGAVNYAPVQRVQSSSGPSGGTVTRRNGKALKAAGGVAGAVTAGGGDNDESRRLQPGQPREPETTERSADDKSNQRNGHPTAKNGKQRADGGSVRRLRSTVNDDARTRQALMTGKAVGRDNSGNLLTHPGIANVKELEGLPGYRIVTMDTDINALLAQGLHVQRSRKTPGMLVAWDGTYGPNGENGKGGQRGRSPGASQEWLVGVDSDAGTLTQERVQDFLDNGDPLTPSTLAGAFPQISGEERGMLEGNLAAGAYTPTDVGRLVDATRRAVEEVGDDPRLVAQAFLGEDGRIDLDAEGTRKALHLAGDSAHRVGARDAQIVMAASLGMKRAVPWRHVRGALVTAAQGRRNAEQSLLQATGVASLGSSKGAMLGFVGAARSYNLRPDDIAMTLDIATGSGVDLSAIVDATEGRGRRARIDKMVGAGLNEQQARSMERVWRTFRNKRTGSGSPHGVRPPSTAARAQFGKLLTDATVIGHETQAMPLASHAVAPFVSSAPGAVPLQIGGTANQVPLDLMLERGGDSFAQDDSASGADRSSMIHDAGLYKPGGRLLKRVGTHNDEGASPAITPNSGLSSTSASSYGVDQSGLTNGPAGLYDEPPGHSPNELPAATSAEEPWYMQSWTDEPPPVPVLPDHSESRSGNPSGALGNSSTLNIVPSNRTESLLAEGREAVQRGDKSTAWSRLTKVLEHDPDNELAWLWLSGVVDSPDDQQRCLENVLVINPGNEAAAAGLRHVVTQTGRAPRVAIE